MKHLTYMSITYLPNSGQKYLEHNQFVYWNFCGWNCPRGTTPVYHRYEEAPRVFCEPLEVKDILIGDEPQTILKWKSPNSETVSRFVVLDANLQREFPDVEVEKGTVVEVAGKRYKAVQHGFKRWWFQLCIEE